MKFKPKIRIPRLPKFVKHNLIAGTLGCVIDFAIEILGNIFFGTQIMVPATVMGNVRMFISFCIIFSLIYCNYKVLHCTVWETILATLLELFVIFILLDAGLPVFTFTPTAAKVIGGIIVWGYALIFVF